jgi:peptide/nickel transport system substrate-binding protein
MSDHPRGLSRRNLFVSAAGAGAVLMTLEEARAQGVAPRRGGTLTSILTPEPPVLVLGVNNQGPTLVAASKIYQGLVKLSPRLEPLPELAASWEISDDKRVYTFRLQPNVKWHDGRDFTAEDVVFSIMKFHMELAPRARQVFQRISEAVAVDAHTARFTLNAPFEPFLLMFDVTSCAIVPKHIFDGSDFRTNPNNQRPIGTGPFQFTEWQRGNFVRLRRFEQYWKPGQPYLDEIIYRVIPDSQSRRLAMQQGQAQLAQANDLEPFDIPVMEAAPNVEVVKTGWEAFAPLAWMEVNHRLDHLKDVRYRKALAHAIDRNFVAQRLWFGGAKPATSPIASGTKFHDADARLPAHDPRAAMQLLDAMGLRPNAQGIRHQVKLLSLPYGEVWTRLSEYTRQALRQVGIDVTIESTDAGGWVRRLGQWEYELTYNFVYQFGDPTLGVARTYISSNIQRIPFTNTAGYSNPRVDELFDVAAREADAAKRAAAFKEVQKLVIEDQPLIWLVELLFPTVRDRRLRMPTWGGTGVHACFDDVFLAG